MFELMCHPDTPADSISAINVRIIADDPHWIGLRWRVEGSANVVLPPLAGRRRRDNLWQTTCFEIFLRQEDSRSYCEFNLSPSESWAAYDFEDYRAARHDRVMARPPKSIARWGSNALIFDAYLPRAGLPQLPCKMAISAVIEEAGGQKSYWAIAHPSGAPDFHDPACFAATLEAPDTP